MTPQAWNWATIPAEPISAGIVRQMIQGGHAYDLPP